MRHDVGSFANHNDVSFVSESFGLELLNWVWMSWCVYLHYVYIISSLLLASSARPWTTIDNCTKLNLKDSSVKHP